MSSPLMLKLFIILVCIISMLVLSKQGMGEEKILVGWIENIRAFPENFLVAAKIDTGADNSSLSAKELTEFIRDDERWVRFTVTTKEGIEHTLERKVHRYTSIKRHGAEHQQRPVVLLKICLGSFYKEAEVNLTDRSRFTYPMLIG